MFAGVNGLILRTALLARSGGVSCLRALSAIGFLVALLFALNFANVTTAHAKVKATTSASEEKNYARIILDFNKLPKYESKVDDTILVFRFTEKVDLNFSKLIEKLPNYIGVARVDPDGRAFRLAFINNFKVNIMEAGSKVFIDILAVGWQGLPPNLPQDVVREITRRAAEIEAQNKEAEKQIKKSKDVFIANLRVGVLPTFTRLSFEWNRFVTAKLDREGQDITLTFGQPVAVDVGRVRSNLPKHLKKIDAKAGTLTSSVVMRVAKGAKVRGFREGNNYVVDLSPSDAQLSKQLDELANKVAGEEKQSGDEKTPGPEEVELVVLEKEPSKKANIEEKADEIEVVRSKFSEFNPDVFDLSMFGDGVNKMDLPAVHLDRSEGDGDQLRSPDADGVAIVERKSDGTIKRRAKARKPRAKTPYLEKQTGYVDVHFPFEKTVAAAGFIRGDVVWLVFDSQINIDLAGVMKSGDGLIKDVRKVKLNNGQLILLKLKKRALFALTHAENMWTASIGEMVTAKADLLHLRRKVTTKDRRYISIGVQQPGHIYWMHDETIGDRVGIVTAFPPAAQLSKPQKFVEFDTFGTAHGIALKPKADDVEMRIGYREVVIARYQGLNVSDGKVLPGRVRGPRKKENDLVGFLDFKKWRGDTKGSFMNQLSSLESKIAAAPNEKKKFKSQRDYVRFLVANELGAESLGLIKRIISEQPVRQNEIDLRLMQAAASIMMSRPRDAIKSLSLGLLHNNDHAALWRGAAKAMLGEWPDVIKQIRLGEDAIGLYPAAQQARFRQAAAEAAYNLKNYGLMEKFLRHLQKEVGVTGVDMKSKLLTAQYLSDMGRTNDAKDFYQKVANSSDAPLSAKAKVDLLNIKIANKEIEPDKALSELEGMQIMWRGDKTELEMLTSLSKLYAERGQYRHAFLTMKQAVTSFPGDQTAHAIQDDMAKVFKSIFLLNKQTKMRPIEALSLFYDFKELTPVGRVGDDMIRILADRLIDVDLLDHAAELLDHQVTKRVHGAARSQVAAKLAMVHLMNRKPILALRTIGSTRQPDLPDQVKRARDLLEARALGEMGRVDGAIDVLNRLSGPEIDRLKADAYWNAQQWRKAGEQLEKILGSSWNSREALAPYQRKDVLRAAISYSLADDAFALSRLRKKFYNKMVNSDDANSFIVVTKAAKQDGEAYKQLAKDIASTNTLDAFMKQYRDQFGKTISSDPLSRGPSDQEG